MVSARLLIANGTVLEVSEKVNKELFWALRGAGHNFGIVLEATFQVYPQQNKGIHHNFDFEFELDRLEDVFAELNKVASPLPVELAVFVIGRKRGKLGNVSIACTPPCHDVGLAN